MNDKNLRRENITDKKVLLPIYPPIFTEKEYPEIMAVKYESQQLTATLSDGRNITIPTVWFKRLREATEEQLTNLEILPDGYGITWPELDEDISVKAFVEGIN